MDTLIGVAAGVIGLILGLLGAATSLSPPATRRGKFAVVSAFAVLSIVAIATTFVERRASEKAAGEAKSQMDALLSSSVRLTDQNQELLIANNNLQLQVQRAAEAPRMLALQQTLKHDIQGHLAAISKFLSERQNQFRQESLAIPSKDYPVRLESFRQQLASTYASDYYPRTQELLKRAAALHLIPDGDFSIDGRFIAAGLLPYIDDLQDVVKNLPD